jgi:dolichyl-diphosphooligosaccharide--protein glycosyltransferase
MRLPVVLLLLLLSVGARLLPWHEIFAPDGTVSLLPADSHYYVRFAQLQRAGFPHWVDEDRFVNFPAGARILWPPVHTYSVALAEVVAGAAGPEAGAAFVGPAWSLLWLAVLAFSLRRAPQRDQALALFVLAIAPISVQAGELGNADHHVHEVFGAALGTWWLLQFLEAPSRRGAVLLGVFAGAARLFSTVGVLAGPLLAAALVAVQVVGVRPAWQRLLELAAAAVTTSVVVVLLFGRFTVEFETLSLFGPLSLLAATCAPVALAGWLERRSVRWLGAVTVLVGGGLLRQGLRAAAQLGAADPLMGRVSEAMPLWSPATDAVGLFHALLLLAPLTVLGLLIEVRTRRALVAVGLALCALLAMGVLQIRFMQAASGALAIAVGPAFAALERLPGRSRALGTGLVAVLLLSLFTTLELRPWKDTVATRARPTMEWLKTATPTAGAPFDPATKPRYGVLAGALMGHFLELWAERPALSSTFSQTSWHLAANAEASKILESDDDEFAWREAKAQRLAYVVLMPAQEVLGAKTDRTASTLARRLYDHDGAPHFTLVHTSRELANDGRPQLKVFAVEGVLDPAPSPVERELVDPVEPAAHQQ